MYNSFGLADDLMEPFRAVVDYTVKRLVLNGAEELTQDVKLELASVMIVDMKFNNIISPLHTSLNRLALSLATVFEKKRGNLDIASPIFGSYQQDFFA